MQWTLNPRSRVQVPGGVRRSGDRLIPGAQAGACNPYSRRPAAMHLSSAGRTLGSEPSGPWFDPRRCSAIPCRPTAGPRALNSVTGVRVLPGEQGNAMWPSWLRHRSDKAETVGSTPTVATEEGGSGRERPTRATSGWLLGQPDRFPTLPTTPPERALRRDKRTPAGGSQGLAGSRAVCRMEA